VNFCPNGYVDEYYKATATNLSPDTTVCRCKCPTLNCLVGCPNGYVIDKYGCKTCECIKPCDIKVQCDLYCKYGHVLDANGCPTCKCIDICPAIACLATEAVNCLYGTNDERGCPTCKCAPCPLVLCARYCLFGYKLDNKTGCQTCECKPAPDCKFGTNSADIAQICPLDCTKGLNVVDGCPTCTCSPKDPCDCGTFVDVKPILCPDGKSEIIVTKVCARNSDDKCDWVRTKCPFGFTVVVPAGKTLTDTDLAVIKAKLGVTDIDFSITKETQTNGDTKYTIWVKQESLPPNKSVGDVNTDIDNTVKTNGGASFVLSDGTPGTSFAVHVIVPMFGVLLAMLFF